MYKYVVNDKTDGYGSLVEEPVPEFKFALREDLENDRLIHFLPGKAESKATGWDVRAAQKDRKDIVLRPGSHIIIPLGFYCFCPEGWWYELRPRSSTFAKKHLNCLYGVIDETYPDEVRAAVNYLPDINNLGKDLVIKFGDPIMQIIPVRRIEMQVSQISFKEFTELNNNRKAERTGGFGSTNK